MTWSNAPVAATRVGGRREREKDEALQNQKICAWTYKIAFVSDPSIVHHFSKYTEKVRCDDIGPMKVTAP